MGEDWPEPVERVATYLRAAGAEARVEEFASTAHTAREAADAIGCEQEQIVKSLVLVCDGKPVLALVPGDKKGDTAKVADAVGGSSARIATASEVEGATGFSPGGVAPFPLPKVHRVLLDRTLLRHDTVWAGAGSDRHMMGLAPSELARLARATVVDVVQADPYHSPGRPDGDPREPKER